MGFQMHIEILGLFGYVFAAAILAILAYERRRDVLSGPYIDSHPRGRLSSKRFRNSAPSAIDRLHAMEEIRTIYLGSAAVC